MFNANLCKKEQIKLSVDSNALNKVETSIQTLSKKEISELEKFGKILNKKNYLFPPTIGREK